MSANATSVGLYGHRRSVVACGLDGRTGELFERRSAKRPKKSAEAAELRALGTALRERGRDRTAGAAEEALNTAFDELRAAQVSIARACALTGRSRATHYRRADPDGVTLGPPAQRPRGVLTAHRS